MKKTSKKANVLKHFNDKFDSRVKEVMGAKKKFMDGGTAGVANSYNPVEGYKVNKGVGKSTMATTPAPAYKKGGVKKYQDGGTPKPMSKKEYKDAKKATKQENKLKRISERGSGKNIDKAAKIAGIITGALGAASPYLLGKRNVPSGPPAGGSSQTPPPQGKRGGSVKSKKRK
jgi:hypothetical protein